MSKKNHFILKFVSQTSIYHNCTYSSCTNWQFHINGRLIEMPQAILFQSSSFNTRLYSSINVTHCLYIWFQHNSKRKSEIFDQQMLIFRFKSFIPSKLSTNHSYLIILAKIPFKYFPTMHYIHV